MQVSIRITVVLVHWFVLYASMFHCVEGCKASYHNQSSLRKHQSACRVFKFEDQSLLQLAEDYRLAQERAKEALLSSRVSVSTSYSFDIHLPPSRMVISSERFRYDRRSSRGACRHFRRARRSTQRCRSSGGASSVFTSNRTRPTQEASNVEDPRTIAATYTPSRSSRISRRPFRISCTICPARYNHRPIYR